MFSTKKFNAQFFGVCILVLSSVIFTGCSLITPKAREIRSGLVNDTTSDLNNAASEIRLIAKNDLQKEAEELFSGLDDQYASNINTLIPEGAVVSAEARAKVLLQNQEYTGERLRLRKELLNKAEKWTIIIRKIQNGSLAIKTLEKMSIKAEDEQKDLLLFFLKTMKEAGASNPELNLDSIDPDLWTIIEPYLNSVVKEAAVAK